MSMKTLNMAIEDRSLRGELRLALFGVGDNDGLADASVVARWCNCDRRFASGLINELAAAGRLVWMLHPTRGRFGFCEPDMVATMAARAVMPCDEAYRRIPQWSASTAQSARLLGRDGGVCHYCGSNERLGLDHVVPRSRGGGHTDDNLVVCCRSCNSSKGTKPYAEFLAYIGRGVAQ